jgi:hypothetical protein
LASVELNSGFVGINMMSWIRFASEEKRKIH